jgi:hypothetical protein
LADLELFFFFSRLNKFNGGTLDTLAYQLAGGRQRFLKNKEFATKFI